MYCTNCGAQIPDGSNSCKNCKMTMPAPPANPPAFSALPPQANFPAAPGGAFPPHNSPGGGMASPYTQPQDYLTHNIVVTVISLFTCSCINLALGIIGIVFASNAKSAFARGDYAAGASAANTAKILFIISLVLVILAVIAILIYIVVIIIMGASGGMHLPGIPQKI